LGFSVRSGITHDIEADTVFDLPASNPLSAFGGEFGADAEFESPATAYLAYLKPITEDYFFTAGIRWTQWNTFEEIRFEFAFTYAVGIDGRINDQWGWRAGVSFTETPATDDVARSVRTIDSDRTAISFGCLPLHQLC